MKYKVTYKNKMHIVDANSVQEAKDKVKLLDADKTVDYYDLWQEINRINRSVLKNTEISQLDSGWSAKEKPIQMGVNWGSIGTVDTNKAEQFASELQKAIKEAKNFKYNGYTITYSKR